MEEIIQNAKGLCSQDLLSLTTEGNSTLGVHDPMPHPGNEYLHLEEIPTALERHRRLRERREKIRITVQVQLIVEAERQRKFTDDINATEAFLRSVQCCRHAPGHHPDVSYIPQQSYV
ncbi:hypothetical protein B0H13DRAFT_2369221 [Mycena leptocephala]|nr:hypothetical protein B0H13DRAFT_2369221 [Mycena leptocephala]